MLDWDLNTALSIALSSVKKKKKNSDLQQTKHNVLKMSFSGPLETSLRDWLRTYLGCQIETSPGNVSGIVN